MHGLQTVRCGLVASMMTCFARSTADCSALHKQQVGSVASGWRAGWQLACCCPEQSSAEGIAPLCSELLASTVASPDSKGGSHVVLLPAQGQTGRASAKEVVQHRSGLTWAAPLAGLPVVVVRASGRGWWWLRVVRRLMRLRRLGLRRRLGMLGVVGLGHMRCCRWRRCGAPAVKGQSSSKHSLYITLHHSACMHKSLVG